MLGIAAGGRVARSEESAYSGTGGRARIADPCPGRFVCPSVLPGSPIRVVEATEHWERPHIAHTARKHWGCRDSARDVLPEALMRSVLVVIGHILPEHPPQVGLAQDQHMV